MVDELRGPDPTTLRMVAWLARSRARHVPKHDTASADRGESERSLLLLARDLEDIASSIEAADEIWKL